MGEAGWDTLLLQCMPVGLTSTSSKALLLRSTTISCCVVSQYTRACMNHVAGREVKAQCCWGLHPPPPPSMFFVMPHHCPQHLPQPLTFLMQVPEGQKSLYHIRQTADHRVPALQHLMDLVYLEQGVESKKGGCRGIP